jgi:[acyl-carrier-protein] S-malonyltransferase
VVWLGPPAKLHQQKRRKVKEMSTAYIFPGQGSQFVGMGKDLYDNCPAARSIYDQADEILGFKISELCFEGPQEKLNATDIQQPAVFVMSVACLEAMRAGGKYQDVKPEYTGGLSLGEYTAYYASGSIDFASALELVAARARLMQEAAKAVDSTMVAIVGLDDDKVLELCDQARKNNVLVAANYNCPGQVVVSGHRPACERIAKLAEQADAMKAIVLDVAGAFHSPLMQSAADKLKIQLDNTAFQTPHVPVIANIDCDFHNDAADIREALYRQVTSSTYWGQSIQTLLDMGVDNFVEIGPKRTLCGFLKRISRRTRCANVGSWEELQ